MDFSPYPNREALIARIVLAVAAAVFLVLPTIATQSLAHLIQFVIAGAGAAALLIRWYPYFDREKASRGLYTILLSLAIVAGVMLSPDSAAHTLSMILSVGVLVLGFVLPPQKTVTRTETVSAPVPTPVVRSSSNAPEIVTHITVTVDGMIRSAEAVNQVVKQQSTGAKEQADVIKLTNDQIDEFIQLSTTTTERARSLTGDMEHATKNSEHGQQALQQLLSGMGQIRQQVSVISETAVQLAQLTRRIDKIITSVSEIATQSNLLALNASIEAARAGAQGRGFAVVADEVRALAQQSTDASSQVRAILGEIQAAVKETVVATEIGMGQVDSGVSEAQSAYMIMTQLNANVQQSYEMIKNISQIIRQQASGMDEIAINMDRINRITEQNLVSTRLAEQVSEQLSIMARDLQSAAHTDMSAHPTT